MDIWLLNILLGLQVHVEARATIFHQTFLSTWNLLFQLPALGWDGCGCWRPGYHVRLCQRWDFRSMASKVLDASGRWIAYHQRSSHQGLHAPDPFHRHPIGQEVSGPWGHGGMEDGRCTNSTKKKSAFSIDQIPFSGFNMFQYVSINILYW